MEGDPSQFEVIGSRLGFRIDSDDQDKLSLVWQGVRFPAFLCLGIATALLFLSVPIVEAIRQRGFVGPAASLWYFPIMNLILLGISLFLLSLKRTILLDSGKHQIVLCKHSFFRRTILCVNYDEVESLRLGWDEVYSGFAMAGSTAAKAYPAPSLRLVLDGEKTVLLDRGGFKRLEALGKRLSQHVGKPLHATEGPPRSAK
jgi:hypothetical protein